MRRMDSLLSWLVVCLVVEPGTVVAICDPEGSQDEDKASPCIAAECLVILLSR